MRLMHVLLITMSRYVLFACVYRSLWACNHTKRAAQCEREAFRTLDSAVANPMQFASESFGFLTSRGLAAWAIAGTAAYVWIVLPQQREERAAMVRICCNGNVILGQKPRPRSSTRAAFKRAALR